MEFGEQELVRLRDALEQAKALYVGAKDEYDIAIQRMHDLGATHTDGSIRHATQVYVSALVSYRNALLEFNRFVLRSKPSI